jgi:diaminopimelate decarboxylase
MRRRYRELVDGLAPLRPLVCYAVKANHNLAVIRTFAALGAGADTVSGGEIERALAAGVPPSRVVLAGLGKTSAEIDLALGHGILQFNVESLDELDQISARAVALGRTAAIALRINPDIAAGGHDKISTGRKGDKFGLPLASAAAAMARARALPGLEPVGLHVHIGSQIADLDAFAAAYARVLGLFLELRRQGAPLRRLDLGGGLGVRHGQQPAVAPAAYGAMLRRVLDGAAAGRGGEVEILLEPGRWLVADAGLLLASVVATKQADGRRFVVLDAGMNALLRPAMYGARHPIMPVRVAPEGVQLQRIEPMATEDQPGGDDLADVVGPICESSDVFGRDYALPPLRAGDLVAILQAGAYGAVMASDYNSRPSPAEVLVDGERMALVRRRREPAHQMTEETIPDWLRGAGGAS